MKSYISNKILFFFLLSSINLSSFTQNIFNLEQSVKYAEYLYKSNEFNLASQEFERILFLDPVNQDIQLKLIKTYRYLNKDSISFKKLQLLYPDQANAPGLFANEYLNLFILQKKYHQAKNFIMLNKSLASDHKLIYSAIIEMYAHDWQKANEIILSNTIPDNNYYADLLHISNESLVIKHKSPFLSAGLSAIIPGTGKVYSGYWKDGLVAFLFTGVSAWQAYRGFNKNGVQSAYGWIYGGFATGFYIGNIYGSAKAANKYNYGQNHKITQQVEKVFNRFIN